MIRITFEFESVVEAAEFLTKGKLGRKTNAVLPALSEPQPVEPEEQSDEKDTPLTPSQRRKAARTGKQDAPKAKGASKKGAGAGKKRDAAPVSDDISDADLSKAASTGAETLTPVGVTAILEQFGVAHVSELEGASRREFLELLDEKIEAEK